MMWCVRLNILLLQLMMDWRCTCMSLGFHAKPVAIPALKPSQFQLLNPQDGSYHFGYDTGSTFQEEKRNASGSVTGKFGYMDPYGLLQVYSYNADHTGYRRNLTTHYSVNMVHHTSIVGPIPFPLLHSRTQPSRVQHIGPQPPHPWNVSAILHANYFKYLFNINLVN